MADKNAIAQSLRRIVNGGRESVDNLLMCTVVSVDGDTCVCQPIDDNEAELVDVRLVAEADATNTLITPVIGSVVGVLAFSDLEVTEYMVALFSKVDTMKLRGDQYAGLVKVAELTTKLNALESDLNALKTIFSTTWTPVPNDGGAALKAASATWYASTITQTIQGDIENTNVKHG